MIFRTVFLLLALFAMISAEEPKPLLPAQLYIVKNRELLQTVLRHVSGDLGRLNWELPPEIDPDDWSNAAWVTDGNELWPIVSLALEPNRLAAIVHPEMYFGDRDFKAKLISEESVLRRIFPKSAITLVRGNRLYLIPYDFPWGRVHELKLEDPWTELQRQYDLAWLSESVELRIFKELPPEKPDEGPFLRQARQRKKSREAENGSAPERMLLGIKFDEKTGAFRVDMKDTTMPDSVKARHRQFLADHGDGFQVGGFYEDKGLVSGALRCYPLDKTYFDHYLLLKFGVSFMPLEERLKTDQTMQFLFSFACTTKSEIEKDADAFELFWSGNLAFAAPLSAPEDRHEAYRINGAELNELNRRTLGSLRHWMENLWQATLTWDKEKPLDIAGMVEDDVAYFGMAFPPGGEEPDWSPLDGGIKAVNDLFYQIRRIEEIENESEPLLQVRYDVTPLETEGETTFILVTAEIVMHGESMYFRCLYARNGDLHCFATPAAPMAEENNDSPDADEFVKKCRPVLQRKIETSKRLQAGKMKVPPILARYDAAGSKARIEMATEGREQRYSFYGDTDSLWILSFFSEFLYEAAKVFSRDEEP